jgi:two-component system NtrC family sensor kinase
MSIAKEKSLEKESILIVDDDENSCKGLSLVFGRKGYEVEIARTGQEALEKAQAKYFNGVLVDIRLPDMAGTELLAPLRKINPDMVLIVLTGYASLETAVQAVNDGASAYITKPLNLDEVLTTVGSVLEKQRLLQEKRQAEQMKNELIRRLEQKNKKLQLLLQELQNAQAQLIQSAKMASLGQLVVSIAHEINNPVSFICSNISRLQEYSARLKAFQVSCKAFFEEIEQSNCSQAQRILPALKHMQKKNEVDFIIKDLGELAQETKEGAKRVSKIVEGLRNFGRAQEELQLVDINDCLQSTTLLLHNQIQDRIEIVTDCDPKAEICGYPNRIKEAFLNLLINASQAISDKGKITLQTAVDASTVYVRISDTGKGIPEENLDRIFEPFYTTKAGNRGTGLGLSIVRSIVKNHKGKIFVNSQLGQGTTFTLTFPHKKRPHPEEKI